jgi:lysophospholipase L1-like esterase
MSLPGTGLAGGFAATVLAAGATGGSLTLNPLDATFIGWIGDSISTPSTTNAPAQYGSSSRLVANWAVSGASWTTADPNFNIPTQYTTNFKNQTRIVIEGGVNDVRSGFTAAQVLAVVLPFVAARRAEGKSVVINNIGPFKNAGGWSAATQAEADTYNGSIAAIAAPPFIKVFNLYALLGDPSDPQALNPIYDSGDHLHPNAAAGAVWAAALAVLSP